MTAFPASEEPLAFLALAADLVAPTMAGLKKNTIRSGRRHIVPGPLEFRPGGGLKPFVVEVVEVAHKMACEITPRELADNGFLSMDHMIHGMGRFYSGFGSRSEITIVRWR